MKNIHSFDLSSEFVTPERCFIVEILNQAGDESCSIARARVQPKVTTKLHALRERVERYVIIQGQGRVEVGGGAGVAVAPLDVVHIPPGVSQRITNTGETDLIFLCICTPRFIPEAYVNLET